MYCKLLLFDSNLILLMIFSTENEFLVKKFENDVLINKKFALVNIIFNLNPTITVLAKM